MWVNLLVTTLISSLSISSNASQTIDAPTPNDGQKGIALAADHTVVDKGGNLRLLPTFNEPTDTITEPSETINAPTPRQTETPLPATNQSANANQQAAPEKTPPRAVIRPSATNPGRTPPGTPPTKPATITVTRPGSIIPPNTPPAGATIIPTPAQIPPNQTQP